MKKEKTRIHLYLISSSLRRKELMNLINVEKKELLSFPFNEEDPSIKKDVNYSLNISKLKMDEFLKSDNFNKLNIDDISNMEKEIHCYLTADTSIYYEGNIYGKPKNKEEAIFYLKTFSNHTHKVVTGYTMYIPELNKRYIYKKVVSKVKFNKLKASLINRYIEEIDVYDKAGAYAIQDDKDYRLIKKIRGDYYNIVGLPISSINKTLTKISKKIKN